MLSWETFCRLRLHCSGEGLGSPAASWLKVAFGILVDTKWCTCDLLYLGGGFNYFLCSPLPGEMIQFDDHIFQMGRNHQLDTLYMEHAGT